MSADAASFQGLTVEKRYSNVYVITLSRGDENRFDSTLCKEYIRALHYVQNEIGPNNSGALVTTSASDKFFSNGVDLWEPDHNPWAQTDGLYPMFAAVLDFPFPTAACVTGHAVGAGCVLALAHDYRVMNSEKGFIMLVSCYRNSFETPRHTHVRQPAVNLGLHFPGIGAIPRLKLRPQMARKMVLEGHRWTGKEAYEDGIVDAVGPPSQIFDEAVQIAEKWSAKAKMGVYGELRHELNGAAADQLRNISYLRRRDTNERAKVKI